IRMNYDHNEKYWSAWAHYSNIGDGFRADLGFVPQVDYRQPAIGYERQWWFEPGDFFSRMFAGAETSRSDDQSGRLIQDRSAVWFFAQRPKQSSLFLGGGHRVSGFRDEDFDQGFLDLEFHSEPVRDVTLGLVAGLDRRID